ncbi:hypothetical protein Leryth_017662 [Lithospermum erythrorhizon]|uniref:Uncharacterized protein n=1 Tax=Lithospermum erythrorhizon TaxID=34254 RepID=A0AAV3QU26_LITER|nr:hypothetical protein Leryth_017662 [Lithospermum erythrorhizon]
MSPLKNDILKQDQQTQHHRKSHIPLPLHKAKSWSPDIHREKAWLMRKETHLKRNHCKSKNLIDSDLDELKACFELGFAFDSSSKLDQKLTQTFPALEFYCDVLNNNKFPKSISRSTSLPAFINNDLSPSSPNSIIEPGDDPEMVKMRLRHWTQVVACSLRISSPK